MPTVDQSIQHPRLDPIPEDEQMQEAEQDPLELQLPPEIAQPLNETCSAADQVRKLAVSPSSMVLTR